MYEHGITIPQAVALDTENWQGRPTITIVATYVTDAWSSKTRIQLTEEAAQSLLSDLLRIIQPAD